MARLTPRAALKLARSTGVSVRVVLDADGAERLEVTGPACAPHAWKRLILSMHDEIADLLKKGAEL